MSDEEDNVVSITSKIEAKQKQEPEEDWVEMDVIFDRAKSAGFKNIVILGLTEDEQMGMVTNIDDLSTLVHILEAGKLSMLKNN